MSNIIYETSHQSRFDARYWMLGAGALGRLRGMVWGGRREEGSGWGTHVYLWQIHVDIWQNQYNIVKIKNKIKLKKKEMLINFPSSTGCEGPFMFQGGGIYVESLVDMIGLFSVHSRTCNRRGLGM